MKANTTCYNCQERMPTCHVTCQRYIDWKEEHEAETETARKRRIHNAEMYEVKVSGIKRMRMGK